MNAATELEVLGPGDVSVIGQQERSRLEALVGLAKMNPRSIEGFRQRAKSLCTINEAVAEQCLYALPRTKKGGELVKIEGPSIRMAEILLKSWKNAAVSGVIIDSGHQDVVVQGTFIDFEDLIMVSKQVKTRILGTHGDARTLAENRAVSIACRNAILGAIPRALWEEAYQSARAVVAGDLDTLEKRRTEALEWLKGKGVDEDRVFNALDVQGISDVGLEQLALLRALVGQVKQGEMTVGEAFPKPQQEDTGKGVAGLASRVVGKADATGASTDTPATDAGATAAPPPDKKK